MLVKPISAPTENGRFSAFELSDLSTPELVALAQSGNREAFAPLHPPVRATGPDVRDLPVRWRRGDGR